MRIGIDARLLTGRHTGDRTYWRGLISGLAALPNEGDEFFLYFREAPETSQLPPLNSRFTIRIVPSPNDRLWSAAAFPIALKNDHADLAHVQYTVSPLIPVPVVTTIADITFKLFPELFTLKDRLLLGATIPPSIRKAAAIIAVSENTRRDILREYPVASGDKVVAVHNGVDPIYKPATLEENSAFRDRLKRKYNIDSPFLLSVGVLQPRKNAPLLIRAFLAARRDAGFAHRLVIVGKKGWLSEETEKAIEDAGDNVLFPGYADDEDLRALYCAADALAYPSLYEGFGLPPVEAMACGCPVIAGNTSSLPEVVGDAGILIDPRDEASWRREIASLLTDPAKRAALGAQGSIQASRFSWTRCAKETLAVYHARSGVLVK